MKQNQNSITIKFNKNSRDLQDALYAYVLSHPEQTQNQIMQDLLSFGLSVATGAYHDQELNNIQEQLKTLIRNTNINNQTLHNLNEGLADVQDAITGQMSDVDMLITPTTNETQRKND